MEKVRERFKARQKEDEQKRSPPGSLAWLKAFPSSKDSFHLLDTDRKNAGQVKFQVSLGHYPTSRMLGLILELLSGKFTGLEIRRPGSLVLI